MPAHGSWFPSPCGVNIVAKERCFAFQADGFIRVSVPLRGKYRSEVALEDLSMQLSLKRVSVPLRGKYRSEVEHLELLLLKQG